MLFDEPLPFEGLPESAFEVFAIPDPAERRKAVIREFHPALRSLGERVRKQLQPNSNRPFHIHLPRLDWPKGYKPFCTWIALSHMAHGYQSSPQLNVGVHADHVSIRLGWDTSAVSFLRFEFLWQHTDVADLLRAALKKPAQRLRVYASAPWPQGSRLAFEDATDVKGSFRVVHERGVWWEVGERLKLPESASRIQSPGLVDEVSSRFLSLLPLYERLT